MQGAASYANVHLKDDFLLSLSLFTKRENEILQYMVQGMSNEAISTLLDRSVFTIRNHRKKF
ncbi:LuxR C-terminal-related transcriptional regulator [Sphingobacterium yanglingense]|uniref:LuxR C-terminal-related transcriptional regulator n=1 Tax=Sphingobacterium yanglingense TaxID=1437280 RepID=UPI00105B7F98